MRQAQPLACLPVLDLVRAMRLTGSGPPQSSEKAKAMSIGAQPLKGDRGSGLKPDLKKNLWTSQKPKGWKTGRVGHLRIGGESEAETGVERETGRGAGSGTGIGNGTKAGRGAPTGTGRETLTGLRSGTGAARGAGTVIGTVKGGETETGPGAETETGTEREPETGTEAGTGRTAARAERAPGT